LSRVFLSFFAKSFGFAKTGVTGIFWFIKCRDRLVLKKPGGFGLLNSGRDASPRPVELVFKKPEVEYVKSLDPKAEVG
jgi:hypothetical protein